VRVLLLGWPLSHSLSPAFQNAAFRAAGLDHQYVVAPREALVRADVRALLLEPDVLGANVTVPHKEAILPCLDDATPLARRVGAVNTVFRRPSPGGGVGLVGDNTDVGGFLGDLRAAGVRLDGPGDATAVVLGAGGAARGVVVALLEVGWCVVVVNRTLERARALVTALRGAGDALLRVAVWPGGPGGGPSGGAGALAEAFERAELVVDTTSLGLGARPGEAGWGSAVVALGRLPLRGTPEDVLFYDLKYGGLTPLGELAHALGRRWRDGLGMLVGQGALAFERWTGLPAPLSAMAEAVGLQELPRL
jgi:shikimate dehydrogenase